MLTCSILATSEYKYPLTMVKLLGTYIVYLHKSVVCLKRYVPIVQLYSLFQLKGKLKTATHTYHCFLTILCFKIFQCGTYILYSCSWLLLILKNHNILKRILVTKQTVCERLTVHSLACQLVLCMFFALTIELKKKKKVYPIAKDLW